MADVFISYFKPERDLTEALARDLEAAGFSVWWDTNLLGDDRFRAVIDEEIEACTRAIIIWTPSSVTREWVVAEADHAHRLGKLINTAALGVDINRLPKPFGQINALALDDRDKIIATVKRAKERVAKAPSTNSARAKYPIGGALFLLEAAERLDAQTRREDWETDLGDYAIHLITAAEEVLVAMSRFETQADIATVGEFADRIWVRRVKAVIAERRKTLGKEIGWLQSHTTHGVITGARGDLRFTAEQLIEACCHK